MRRNAIAAALCISALCGCQSAAPMLLGGQSPAAQAPATVADAEKALTLAHLAYQGVGDALKAAAQGGVLHGVDASTARSLYDRVGAALDAADAADAAADARGMFAAIAQANDLIARLRAFTAPK